MIRHALTVGLIWVCRQLMNFNEFLLLAAKRRVQQDIFKRDGANKK